MQVELQYFCAIFSHSVPYLKRAICIVGTPTWLMCTEHLGMTSLLCRDMRSSSWLTRNEGGRALTPPRGIVINSRQMGQRNDPVSRVWEAAILDRQCKHTVCEQGRSFGVCSPPSYRPANRNNIFHSSYGQKGGLGWGIRSRTSDAQV